MVRTEKLVKGCKQVWSYRLLAGLFLSILGLVIMKVNPNLGEMGTFLSGWIPVWVGVILIISAFPVVGKDS